MALQQLEEFLVNTEKRAFRMARFSVGNDADALDIVQDAMMKLVENYAHKSSDQWKPLFYRILQNRIMDFHRGQKNRWAFWKSANDDEFQSDIFDHDQSQTPASWLTAERLSAAILSEIENLPRQQQQCFLLRGWEGLSVRDTAQAMQISEGSVKTHYSRAMARLNKMMEHEYE